MNDPDDRVRANLIESLWKRQDPEVEEILKRALNDPHHRVAANAVYGLYLLGSDSYPEGLDRLLGSRDPRFRRSAAWVLRSTEGVQAAARFKTLIRDPDPGVRHAAFNALIFLREKGCAKQGKMAEPGLQPAPALPPDEYERAPEVPIPA